MSLEIKDHENSKRIKVIGFQEQDLDKLIFPFKKHTINLFRGLVWQKV